MIVGHKTTTMAKPGQVEQKWYVVDANNKVLGRLATEIATILMGKHRAEYTPHVDTGEFVVVINADKVVMTGRKFEKRHLTWFTGYTRQRLESYGDRLERKPTDVLYFAVKRMLPKSKLGKDMLDKLKLYAGPEHPHQAQQPTPIDLG